MDEIRSRIYGEIWTRTKELAARGESPPPFPDQTHLFSLTFIACRRPELGADSDFSAAFVDALGRFQSEAMSLAPALTPAPRERFHITLFPLYLDRPEDFFQSGT